MFHWKSWKRHEADVRLLHVPYDLTSTLKIETVDVSAAHSTVSLEQVNPEQSMSAAEMLAVPFPASNTLKNAFRVMPGVVQDVRGGVHLNGGTEEQTVFLLNGFNINDPITGRFESRMGVEAVQAVNIGNGILPAQFGKGAAGTISISTTPGDDKIRYSATNFFPGFESHKGFYLGNWSPRVNFSGPIRKGRAWFSDSIAVQYDKQVLEELPDGADSMSSWRIGNYLHSQVNLTPRQILYAGLLVNGWTAPRTGLGILSPRETTIDRRSNQWFFNIKDQLYLGRGSLIEFGYAANRTYGREIPQGTELFRITPDGNSGNAYIDATRKAGRDQWLLNGIAPALAWQGTHQLKAGLDLDRLTFWQNTSRTGLEQYGPGVTLTARVLHGQRRTERLQCGGCLVRAGFVEVEAEHTCGTGRSLRLGSDIAEPGSFTANRIRVGAIWQDPHETFRGIRSCS